MAKKSSGFPTWAWWAIGSGVVAVVLMLGCAGVGVAFLGWAGSKATPSGSAAAGKIWDRDELAKAVFKKSPDEVKAILGTPSNTTGNPDRDDYAEFYYHEKVLNPHSGKKDGIAVTFQYKKVSGIKY